MYNREIRDYEVSIWTLQDSFIAVLKASKLENKGHIEDPKMVIKDDGTREFSFSLPMYLYDGPDKKENPIWYTVRNGNLLVNMRKIKVIFNKMTKNEEVFEFIITKVTESHENDELTCDVECEGLAFHELGKIGYKISLGQDDFLNEYNDWADGKLDGDEPHATLNYWCDKVLKNSKWTYCVRMDWAAYDGLIPVRYIGDGDEPRFRNLGWGLIDRNAYLASSEEENNLEEAELATKQELSDSSNFELLDYFSLTDDDFIILNAYKKERNFRLIDKIYEDEYVSSWNVDSNSDVLTPASVEKFREKERIIDVKESNIYNITQTIAETFGVFCRYEYEYDADYHIIGRRIIFYNNFIQEATGTIDLNYSGNESSKFTGAVDLSYPYNTSHIEREMDGTDIITKMFVKNLSDNASDSGLATIMDTDANKSGEDYLLNFDYMYSIGTISQEQYEEIPKFEKKVKKINNQLVPLSNHITYLENELNDVKADKTIAENSIALDNERLEAADQAIKAITQDANSNPDPDNPGAIMVTENRPNSCFLTIDRGINGRYIRLTYTGVLRDTLKLYETYDKMGATGEKLSKQLKSGYEVEEDEYGNITRIIINVNVEDNTVYATYSYKPDLYYENIKKLWNKRLKDDQEKLDKAKSRIEKLEGTEETEGQIEKLRNDYNDLITQKENLIARFERMMGPALREGNWQPEDDYANYGDKKTVVQRLDLNSVFNDDVEISIGWNGEEKLFDGEDKSYELVGADTTTREYYPFINLENNFDVLRGKEELKQYSFCFYDKDLGDIDDPAYYKYFAIGSRSRLGFLKINDKIKPVLFLSDTDSLPAKEKILNPFIGKITIKETEGQNGFEYQEERLMDVTNIDYSQNEIVYPRIQICSSRLKVSEDQLSIYFDNKLLKNYEDYYINSRTNDDTYLTTYYITIKPEFLFKNGFGDFTIHYAISNTGLIMYLDAIQVLKENAYPQVSYTIDPSLVNKNFTHLAYKTLNKIVHINDYELKFENILGYISELELDLDHPWEDSITITNYKTKFEDLFSSIVAQTEDMKKNSYIIGMAASAFTDYGTLSSEFMQNSINKPDLSYAFNNGKLTIDNENGIWGISDDGVVAMRGGGIFTANEQDSDGNWIWNTGILPSGINASLITTGQLDTNLIRIFAGDDLRFQMNGDGIFAYKDDAKVDDDHPDAKYYARYYSEGLFLHVDDGVKVADDTYVKTEDGKGIDRVELSWDGLILRDWNNEKTLSTDPDTGDLTVKGNIQATSLTLIGEDGEAVGIDGLTKFNLDPNLGKILPEPDYDYTQHKPFVQMDSTVGLLIAGIAEEESFPFFQVTSRDLGFFKYRKDGEENIIEPLLYYNDGNLTVTGTIHASSGWLGGNEGWRIDQRSINHINDYNSQDLNNVILSSNELSAMNESGEVLSKIRFSDGQAIFSNIETSKIMPKNQENELKMIEGLKNLSTEKEENLSDEEREERNIISNVVNEALMNGYQVGSIEDFINKLAYSVYTRAIYQFTSNEYIANTGILEFANINCSTVIIIGRNTLAKPIDNWEKIDGELPEGAIVKTDTDVFNEGDYKEDNNEYYKYIINFNLDNKLINIKDLVDDNAIILKDENTTLISPIVFQNCQGYFEFHHIKWNIPYATINEDNNIDEDNNNNNNNENDSNDNIDEENIDNTNETTSKKIYNNEYCLKINYCHPNINLVNCWIDGADNGIVAYGGNISWYNTTEANNMLIGACEKNFAIAGIGSLINIFGAVPASIGVKSTGGILSNEGTMTSGSISDNEDSSIDVLYESYINNYDDDHIINDLRYCEYGDKFNMGYPNGNNSNYVTTKTDTIIDSSSLFINKMLNLGDYENSDLNGSFYKYQQLRDNGVEPNNLSWFEERKYIRRGLLDGKLKIVVSSASFSLYREAVGTTSNNTVQLTFYLRDVKNNTGDKQISTAVRGMSGGYNTYTSYTITGQMEELIKQCLEDISGAEQFMPIMTISPYGGANGTNSSGISRDYGDYRNRYISINWKIKRVVGG